MHKLFLLHIGKYKSGKIFFRFFFFANISNISIFIGLGIAYVMAWHLPARARPWHPPNCVQPWHPPAQGLSTHRAHLPTYLTHLPAQGFGNTQKVLQCAQNLRKNCDTQRLRYANAVVFGLVANTYRKVVRTLVIG